MAVIIKELMNGCDNLDPAFSEEAIGHNALAAGFQGQRQWTDFYPNGDFAEAILNSSFDWNGAREPYNLIIASGDTADVDYVVTSDRRMLETMPEVCLTPARALELIGILG